MQLPSSLRRAIEHLAQGHSISSLAQSAARISAAYRETREPTADAKTAASTSTAATAASTSAASLASAVNSPILSNEIDRVAYLVTRLPATYAAALAVFSAIRERMPDLAVESILDLGAGPGTASWAALEKFPDVRSLTLLEKNSAFAALGKSLATQAENNSLQSAKWTVTDIVRAKSFPPSDLVVLSYSIGEVSAGQAANLLHAAWDAAGKVLALIEPGTPAGFARIRAFREELIRRGGHMLAPCPHADACPMTGDDWCHFAARVERSSLHRRVKGGMLSYEDEKYSYIAMSKIPVQPAQARIIRHPQQHPGFIELRLCAAIGLQDIVVSRRHKAEFRQAKKSSWGSAWDAVRSDES